MRIHSLDFPLQIKTVKVSNVSQAVSGRDIKEFFSFSGDIQYVEMRRFTFFLIILATVLLLGLLF